MSFDVVVISDDRYFVEALEQELFCVGLSCGVGIGALDDQSIAICDLSAESVFPKIDNTIIYIFPSDADINISEKNPVFIKPFLMSELIKAVMKMKYGSAVKQNEDSAFSISVSDTFLIVCGKRVDLTKNEMLIFNALFEKRGNAVGREHLEMITRANSNGNMVTVYINRLREKLSAITEKKIIVTVRDKGYMIPEF